MRIRDDVGKHILKISKPTIDVQYILENVNFRKNFILTLPQRGEFNPQISIIIQYHFKL